MREKEGDREGERERERARQAPRVKKQQQFGRLKLISLVPPSKALPVQMDLFRLFRLQADSKFLTITSIRISIKSRARKFAHPVKYVFGNLHTMR